MVEIMGQAVDAPHSAEMLVEMQAKYTSLDWRWNKSHKYTLCHGMTKGES